MNKSPRATSQPALEPPTLDTCATEPIHVPGAIQPHGALLAFDLERKLTHFSANVLKLLDIEPLLGEPLDAAFLAGSPATRAALEECFAEVESGSAEVAPVSCQITLNGNPFDLVTHASRGVVVAEFELRAMSADDVSTYAVLAHRAMLKLKRQQSEEALLDLAVSEVRRLTGFDRVMAYRFRQDDSGDVVAEALLDGLEPYLGRRYPASDIPAQARRLYTVSTLRVIPDINYVPQPLLQLPASDPLDMSYCTLRSVSPIHIEYLNNIGVAASMSVSIVDNGRLWGMIACHHMSPRYVPYAVRIACDVLAQLLASAVQELTVRKGARRIADTADMQTRLVEDALHSGELLGNIEPHLAAVRNVFEADAVLASLDDDLVLLGDIDTGSAHAIVAALGLDMPAARGEELIAHSSLATMPEALRTAVGQRWCGVLASRFDVSRGGWIVALRKEQIETVRWGGQPEKQVKVGPSGPRLTPRGSFAEWRETVRHKALPWTEADLHIARNLGGLLVRANNARMADAERVRNQFLAILGHDLRGPLHVISMAAQMLQRGNSSTRMINTILSSSTRMQRLVTQMLDVSRLENGLGLGLKLEPTDLVSLLDELLEEAATAHADIVIERAMPVLLMADVDRDRVSQMLGNILANARQHGTPGSPISLTLTQQAALARIDIRNLGAPIEASLLPGLFDPFRRSLSADSTNRSGMGLGLYIAREIALGHGGDIAYAYVETDAGPRVQFSVTLALSAEPDSGPGS